MGFFFSPQINPLLQGLSKLTSFYCHEELLNTLGASAVPVGHSCGSSHYSQALWRAALGPLGCDKAQGNVFGQSEPLGIPDFQPGIPLLGRKGAGFVFHTTQSTSNTSNSQNSAASRPWFLSQECHRKRTECIYLFFLRPCFNQFYSPNQQEDLFLN